MMAPRNVCSQYSRPSCCASERVERAEEGMGGPARKLSVSKLDQDDFHILDMDYNYEAATSYEEELCAVDDFRTFMKAGKDCWTADGEIRTKHDFAHGKDSLKSMDFDSLCYSSDDLVRLCIEIFIELELDTKLQISRTKLEAFVNEIRRRMFDNPYHNWFHVVDVVQTIYCFGLMSGLIDQMNDNERFALIVAALCHDIEHPGVGNKFLVESQSELASLYGMDVACTEKHHSFRASELLTGSEFGLLDHVTIEGREEITSLVRGMILATSMDRHGDYMSALRAAAAAAAAAPAARLPGDDAPLPPAAGESPAAAAAERRVMMELLIKCADTSNVLKPFPVARRWALRITDEFFLQGDLELASGMTVTPACDRRAQSRVALQRGFIDHVIGPFHRAVADRLPGLGPAVARLQHTRAMWGGYPDDAALLADLARARRAAED